MTSCSHLKPLAAAALTLALLQPAAAASGRDFQVRLGQEFLHQTILRNLELARAAGKVKLPVIDLDVRLRGGGVVELAATAAAGDLTALVPGYDGAAGRLAALGWRLDAAKRVRLVFRGRVEGRGGVEFRPVEGGPPVANCNVVLFEFGLKDIAVEILEKSSDGPVYSAPEELKRAALRFGKAHLAELAIGKYLRLQTSVACGEGGGEPLDRGHRVALHVLMDRFPFVPFALSRVTTEAGTLRVEGRQLEP